MSEEIIKKKSVKAIIAQWRIRHGFDHACYEKIYKELYKRITEHGKTN
jgi:NADPH-dependent 7-cyano-7-deazaguanine reductase QueF